MASSGRRNAAGGLHVSRSDIEAAINFLDVQGKGKVTMDDLKSRLPAFYGDLPLKEYQLLMGDEEALGAKELYELLRDNTIADFDPVAEAFKVYDPHGTGYVDLAVLRRVFQQLGFKNMSEDDVQVLLDSSDVRQCVARRSRRHDTTNSTHGRRWTATDASAWRTSGGSSACAWPRSVPRISCCASHDARARSAFLPPAVRRTRPAKGHSTRTQERSRGVANASRALAPPYRQA